MFEKNWIRSYIYHKMNRQVYKKIVVYIILAVILILAFAIRFRGLPFGLPLETHPDEPRVVNSALRIVQSGEMNPHFFDYPSMYIYMQAALFKVTKSISYGTNGDYKSIKPLLYSRGRLMTVFISMGTIFVVFLLCRMFFGSTAALAAASFLAFSYNHIANSFLITVDSPMTFFVLMSIFMSVLLQVKGPAWKFYIWNSIFIGFAVGCKYTAVFAALPFFFAHFAVSSFSFKKIFNRKGFIAILLMIVAFLITTPYSILDYHTFQQHLNNDLSSYAGGLPGSEMESRLSYGPYFSYLVDGFGVIPLLFALGGGLVMLFYHRKYDKKMGFLLLIFPVFFFLFIGGFRLSFMRNLMPILPFLSIFAGVSIKTVWDMAVPPSSNSKRTTQALWFPVAALVIALGLYGMIQQGGKAVKYVRTITLPDTRSMCKDWIEKHLPPGARIILDFYTMGLDKKKFKIKRLSIGAMGNYRNYIHFDYIVTSNYDYNRFFKNEKKYLNRTATYREIFTYPLIQEFKPNGITSYGPILRIFQVEKKR